MVRHLKIMIPIGLSALFIQCQKARMGEANNPENENTKSAISNCSIESLDDTTFLAEITCPDGSSLKIPRAKDGQNGSDGLNGTSCSVEATNQGALIRCEDGSQAFVKNGEDGKDGSSCSVQSVDQYSSLIECSDGSQSLIDLNSLAHYSIEELIDPCGDDPQHFDEIIMKFNNGDLLAYFDHQGKRFLTKLQPGSYQTTDHQQCHFMVLPDGQIQD